MHPRLVLIVLLFALLVPATHAAPPANDNFTNRTIITVIPTNIFGTTVDATVEPDEPTAFHQLSTVWYQWTAPVDGNIRLRAYFTNDGHSLVGGIFTGETITNLTQFASVFAPNYPEANFPVLAGATYQFRFAPDQDTPFPRWDGPFNFTLEYNTPPPNDHFTNRIRLTNDVELISYRYLLATTEPGEPPYHAGGRTAWYEWTPTQPGLTTHLVNPNNFGSGGVTIYYGEATNLIYLTNTCDHQVLFYATNGVKYFFQFDSCNNRFYAEDPINQTWVLSHMFASRTLDFSYSPTNGARWTILRDPDIAYSVASTTNLTGPWSEFYNLSADEYGPPTHTFNFPQATNSPVRFYGAQPLLFPRPAK
jgi:hypothetical protein